jgi:hypothetical protein
MEKTTLYLHAAVYRRLKRLAAARKRTPAALVREAVAEYVAREAPDEAPRSVGAFVSGRTDLSERGEELLAGLGRKSRGRR